MALPILVMKRSLSTSSVGSNIIKNVTVVGGGLMGSGIAQVAAQTGHTVTLVEVNDAALQKAKTNIHTSIQRVAKKLYKENPAEGDKFLADSLKRIHTSVNVVESVKDADLVIEAILENVNLKLEMFSSIDKVAPDHTIFASNTSSLTVGEIAINSTRKDRFGGLHFFNPVPMMKLLEVIRIPETSDATYERMMSWGKAMGKTCITCKDTPGFVVNRLLIPFSAEAFRLLERGDATARDIDIAMKLGAGHPMGPFELVDYTGIDLAKFILDGWHKRFPNNPLFEPIGIVDKLVSEGKFGIKAGEGFYKYSKTQK